MPELPWFPMYARDWLSGEGTSMMLPEQEGAFIRLLCVAWGDGSREPSLPTEAASLAQISRLGTRWKRLGVLLLEQFAERDGRLYNAKLSHVWNEQRGRSERLANNGRKGGLARAGLEAGLEPGLSRTQANGKHTEAESETETELHQSVSPAAAEDAAGLAILLETDADRTALAVVVGKSRSEVACVASLLGMFNGMDVARPPTPAEFGRALRDYAANAADWNAAHFRGYLKRAMTPDADPRRPAGLRNGRGPAGSSPGAQQVANILGTAGGHRD